METTAAEEDLGEEGIAVWVLASVAGEACEATEGISRHSTEVSEISSRRRISASATVEALEAVDFRANSGQ